MDIPISRASAFMKRNRTTHSWCDDWSPSNDVMSHSCPSPRTLAEHMRQARHTHPVTPGAATWHRGSRTSDSSPIVIRAKSQNRGYLPFSSASSPGPTLSLQVPGAGARQGLQADSPSSAYSYDGGFFVTANTANKDFFVIHPEWVSETETDEPKQILHLNAWIRLAWFDCQLQWNPRDYGNISHLIMPYAAVWTPDITLYDNAVGQTPGLKDYRVKFYSDGTVHYNFPTVISVMCQMDVTYFPFDIQTCPLVFGSWSYHGLELDVTNRSAQGDVSSYIPNSELDIVSIPVKRHVAVYGCCPEPFPDVTFYVHLKRKPFFYVVNLIFPCMLMTSLAVLGFVLPMSAGKVSLEVTVLLSQAVFLLVISETLPPSSETFPLIGMYFSCSMVLVSLSTILTVIVLNIHDTEYRPLPSWMRTVFLHYLAKVVFFSKYTATSAGSKGEKTGQKTAGSDESVVSCHITGQHDGQPGCPSPCGQWQESGHLISHKVNSGTSTATANCYKTKKTWRRAALREETLPPWDPSPHFAPSVLLLNEQFRLMKKTEARLERKDKRTAQHAEWKKVAMVLDRFFLLVFFFCAVITSLAVLWPLFSQS